MKNKKFPASPGDEKWNYPGGLKPIEIGAQSRLESGGVKKSKI